MGAFGLKDCDAARAKLRRMLVSTERATSTTAIVIKSSKIGRKRPPILLT